MAGADNHRVAPFRLRPGWDIIDPVHFVGNLRPQKTGDVGRAGKIIGNDANFNMTGSSGMTPCRVIPEKILDHSAVILRHNRRWRW